MLETLASTIRSDKDIRGIMVDGQEIKLGLFADDLTGFLKNDKSLIKFLELVLLFGKCSGLVINHDKSEILLLGNSFPAPPNLDHTPFKDLKMKISVKILGVYFTYDRRLRRKLNFDEFTKTIRDKLRIWKWRDLTIILSICMDKEFVNEVNKLIFDFIWKGKDKVKRRVLVGDIEDGGLKAPHLDSIIKPQRILCCKKLASEDLSSWKIILLHYLKPVGGKFILGCNFDVKKLPI